jgi:hypothetical protein
LPHFYDHLSIVQDGMELLFVHRLVCSLILCNNCNTSFFGNRWILLCFKREFPEADALRMWEACWAHYQTDYFHLFICTAIIAVYGEDVVQQKLPADEMLLHFSSLSMHMSGDVVLRKVCAIIASNVFRYNNDKCLLQARGLLHKFRTREKIPCTLEGICSLCSSGMWDSGHVPVVECTGSHDEQECPYGGKCAWGMLCCANCRKVTFHCAHIQLSCAYLNCFPPFHPAISVLVFFAACSCLHKRWPLTPSQYF